MNLSPKRIFILVDIILTIIIVVLVLLAQQAPQTPLQNTSTGVSLSSTISQKIPGPTEELINRSNDEWRKILTPAQYQVLREAGTETPGSSDLNHNTVKGTYVTADCGEPVFRSEQKFDSGTGWPSFWAPIEGSVLEKTDSALGISRTEIVSKKCGSHLGHVFDDGPKPTGLRYCINGIALRFIPDEA